MPPAIIETRMKYYRVELLKSLIGMNKRTKAIAESLYLSRINSYRYLPVTASTAGSILKLRSLVDVQLLSFETNKDLEKHMIQERKARKAEDGFKVINRL